MIKYKLTIEQDTICDSPREDDNLGTMACSHRNYVLGDKDASVDDVPEDAVCLNLHIYEHGGITMNTTGFYCPLDSSTVGCIYVTREKAREWLGSAITDGHIENALQNEVAVYDQWLRGDVYQYQLETLDTCPTCEHEHSTTEDSCAGFYGDNWAENGILDNLDTNILEYLKANDIQLDLGENTFAIQENDKDNQ